MGTRLIFCVFFTSQLWSVVSPRIFEQNHADLFGVSMYYCLTLLKSFYLSPKHLNVTSSSSVPNFATFQEINYFLFKVAQKQLVTESFFFYGHFPIFQGDIEPTFTLLSSCKQMLHPFKHNVVWAFLAKKRRHQTLLCSGFSGKIGKIKYLRRYLNRITILYKCGTWLIRFFS